MNIFEIRLDLAEIYPQKLKNVNFFTSISYQVCKNSFPVKMKFSGESAEDTTKYTDVSFIAQIRHQEILSEHDYI